MPADEFLLVESSRFEGQIPKEMSKMIPNMTLLYINAELSCESKNRAVEAATGDWLAIVDADCIPQLSEIKVLRAAIAMHPDVAAVSGRTLYHGRLRIERVLGLLSRLYLDPGFCVPTRFISDNAACF